MNCAGAKTLPEVILHSQVSLDGRTEGFAPDLGLHYQTAFHRRIDVHLTGSDTLLASAGEPAPEGEATATPPPERPGDSRPLLAATDSRGRVRHWAGLLRAPYWRGGLALCSRATPPEYLEFLRGRRVGCVVAGEGPVVDLRAALAELGWRYQARTVLLDSGGALAGAMLRAGLVSELSLLVRPCLVGDDARPFFGAPALEAEPLALRVLQVEHLPDDVLWLRYTVGR